MKCAVYTESKLPTPYPTQTFTTIEVSVVVSSAVIQSSLKFMRFCMVVLVVRLCSCHRLFVVLPLAYWESYKWKHCVYSSRNPRLCFAMISQQHHLV